jgi:hypothetical protein
LIIFSKEENHSLLSMTRLNFCIELTIRTADGFENYGKFFIGTDRRFAYNIFKKLKGNTEVSDKSFLHLQFIEVQNGLPVNIQLLSCSLEELAENCRIITKETFKFLNLEEI